MRMSQILIVWSEEHAATHSPSGWKVTSLTGLLGKEVGRQGMVHRRPQVVSRTFTSALKIDETRQVAMDTWKEKGKTSKAGHGRCGMQCR
jgi:hypothetical protein